MLLLQTNILWSLESNQFWKMRLSLNSWGIYWIYLRLVIEKGSLDLSLRHYGKAIVIPWKKSKRWPTIKLRYHFMIGLARKNHFQVLLPFSLSTLLLIWLIFAQMRQIFVCNFLLNGRISILRFSVSVKWKLWKVFLQKTWL